MYKAAEIKDGCNRNIFFIVSRGKKQTGFMCVALAMHYRNWVAKFH